MFKQRCISAVFLVIIALVTILSGGYILAGTLLVISMIAFSELSRACKIHTGKGPNGLEITGYAAILIYYGVLIFCKSERYLILTLVFFLIVLMGVYVFTFPKYHASQVMNTFFSVFYAPVMFSFLYETRQLENGIYFVWLIFISSWISDTFAYLSGMLLGRHKLAPVLSPKKSIEGSIGGILGSALAGALFGLFLYSKGIESMQFIIFGAVIGAVGSVVSQIGDLAASAIKRNYEIKDYGKLIPGHGGIMDRFDSVIVTAPMIYFLIILFLEK